MNVIVKEKLMSRRFPNTLTLAILALALPPAACKKAEPWPLTVISTL